MIPADTMCELATIRRRDLLTALTVIVVRGASPIRGPGRSAAMRPTPASGEAATAMATGGHAMAVAGGRP